MSALVDIHTHLLPGIDDGPPDIESSLLMARAAVGAGIGTIAVTPHLRSDFPDVHVEEIARRCENLRAVLAEAEISLRVIEGAEVSLLWALDARTGELRQATFGQGGSDILIETPPDASIIDRLLRPLLDRGLRVTLGHPERSRAFQERPDRLAALSQAGVLAQVNAGSLLAPRRTSLHRCAAHLCRAGLAQVIASDGHRGDGARAVTLLPAAVEAATRIVGPARARWMASDAPAAIIEGRALPPPPESVATEGGRRFFWQRR